MTDTAHGITKFFFNLEAHVEILIDVTMDHKVLPPHSTKHRRGGRYI